MKVHSIYGNKCILIHYKAVQTLKGFLCQDFKEKLEDTQYPLETQKHDFSLPTILTAPDNHKQIIKKHGIFLYCSTCYTSLLQGMTSAPDLDCSRKT